jgi:hypothetical protein
MRAALKYGSSSVTSMTAGLFVVFLKKNEHTNKQENWISTKSTTWNHKVRSVVLRVRDSVPPG